MKRSPSSSIDTNKMGAGKKNDFLLGMLLLLFLGIALTITANAAGAIDHTAPAVSTLTVSKSADTLQPLPDQVVTFSIEIQNSGAISATNGTINDDLDSNLTFIGPVHIEGGGNTAVAGTPPAIASGLTISPSTSVTITFPVRVNSDLPSGSEIKNTAVAESIEYTAVSSNDVKLTVAEPTEVIWKQRSTGIDGGQVNVLAVDLHHADNVYAGTPVGLFKSSDGGYSWIAANDGLGSLQVESLALDPLHSGILYAGTHGGVFKSINGGQSWVSANNGLSGSYVSGLAIDPGQPAVLYAGTELGVFKSSDGGSSWIDASAGLSDPSISTLALDPRHSYTLYAGTRGSGVFKSSDGGASWAPANSGLDNLDVHVISADPLNDETLYAGTGAGLFKSENNGANWTAAGGNLAGLAIFSLSIDPTNSSILYAGTDSGIAKSSSGGSGWSLGDEGEILSLAIDPTNPSILYAGTANKGVLKSEDSAGSWLTANEGLTGGDISALAVRSANSNLIFAGTPGKGVYKSDNGGRTWEAANNGLANLDVNAFAVLSGNNSILYAATGDGLFKSSDNGDSWLATSSGLTNKTVHAVSIHSTKSQVLYAGTGGGGVFRSNNGGDSWFAANAGLTDLHILDLAIDPNDGEIIYAGTKSSGVFKSSNGGTSWAAANSGLTLSSIETLAVDPAHSQFILAGGSDGLFKSSDGGSSWASSSDGLGDAAVQDLVFDPANSTIVYAATSAEGVFRSTGGGFKWAAVNEGLAILRARTLALAASNTLYAGTMGGGVFSSGPHIDVTKQVDNSHPQQGDALTYTILINNSGTLPISEGTVTDNLNSSLEFVGPVTVAGGGAAVSTASPPQIVKNLALTPGETATVTLPARVKTGLANGTTILNSVTVNDPDLHQPATAQVTVTAYQQNKLTTNQAVDNPAPQAGEVVNFTITVKNIGNHGVGGINVVNTLDSSLTFIGPVQIIGSSGMTGDPPLIASGMGLDAGRQLTVKFPAKVNAYVAPGTRISNNAGVSSIPWPGPIYSQVNLVVGDMAAKHIYVDKAAVAGLKDGSSWENAYPNLQDALVSAGSGSEIWVAAGTYYPDEGSVFLTNDPAATFQLRSGVAIYGGFSGIEESLEERDPASHLTILSGDIDGNDSGSCDRAHGAAAIMGTNSTHVVTSSGVNGSALLDGFIISGGSAQGGGRNQHGGGMANDGSSPGLANSTWAGNTASQWGGGLSTSSGDPRLTNPVFSGNLVVAKSNGQQSWGGGLYVGGGQPMLANATLTGNWAAAQGTRPADEGLGGGLFVAAGEVTIYNSIFWNNEGDRTPDLLVAAGGTTKIKSSRLDGCPQFSVCDRLVSADPQFVLPVNPTSAPTAAGNLGLQPGSALVDAGDNALVPAGVLTDRAGEARIYNGVVDMGAFELPIACPSQGVTRLYVDGSVTGGDNSGLD